MTDRPAARAAWELSFLSSLRGEQAGRLLAAASEVGVAPGEVVYRGRSEGGPELLALVVEGLLRVYWTSGQGRQVTARYASQGDVLGVPALFSRGAPVEVQALTAAKLLRLPAGELRAVAQEDGEVGWAVAEYLAGLVFDTQSLLAENVFLPVRQRVARHLLDLAERDGGRLVVRASQQDVANAIGSVREVVSRVLGALRADGLVARDGAVEAILDPAGVHRVAKGG